MQPHPEPEIIMLQVQYLTCGMTMPTQQQRDIWQNGYGHFQVDLG